MKNIPFVSVAEMGQLRDGVLLMGKNYKLTISPKHQKSVWYCWSWNPTICLRCRVDLCCTEEFWSRCILHVHYSIRSLNLTLSSDLRACRINSQHIDAPAPVLLHHGHGQWPSSGHSRMTHDVIGITGIFLCKFGCSLLRYTRMNERKRLSSFCFYCTHNVIEVHIK